MPSPVRALLLGAALLLSTSPAYAQSSADEKELASYRLTMATLDKVAAAMRTMAQEMKSDPRYQQQMKRRARVEEIEAQQEKLQEKDELSKADEARLEALDKELEKLREDEEREDSADTNEASLGSARTITEMENGIKKVPALNAALQRNGLSAREYAKFMLAMLQAGMIHGFSQGKVDYAKLPPGVNPENVKFVGEHKAELDALQKEFGGRDGKK